MLRAEESIDFGYALALQVLINVEENGAASIYVVGVKEAVEGPTGEASGSR
jgi:hypothetical protein